MEIISLLAIRTASGEVDLSPQHIGKKTQARPDQTKSIWGYPKETSEDIHGHTTEFFLLSTDGYGFKIVAESCCPLLSVLEAEAATHNLARFPP